MTLRHVFEDYNERAISYILSHILKHECGARGNGFMITNCFFSFTNYYGTFKLSALWWSVATDDSQKEILSTMPLSLVST